MATVHRGRALSKPYDAELDGARVVVLELVDGGSLLHLAYAWWNRGDATPVLHRDISPHDVLVGRDGVAKLADFGIARLGDSTGSTETGSLKGKLAYMAAELFNGKKATAPRGRSCPRAGARGRSPMSQRGA